MNTTLASGGLKKAIFLRDRPATMCGGVMIRITLFYQYRLASSLRPLSGLQAGATLKDSWYTLYNAETALTGLLSDLVIGPALRMSVQSINALIRAVKKLTSDTNQSRTLDLMDIYSVQSALTNFETVFGAELEVADVYLVIKKRGYDTLTLINKAENLFPPKLVNKVPEAVLDIQQAGKCIAFELPTAAGFHLHRANELVLHRYYDAVTGGEPRPKNRNIGGYLNALDKHGVGDEKVKSALRDLKDLHRNPLIHPEDTLESIDDAIALLGSIQAVVVHMLKEIPENPLAAALLTHSSEPD